MYGRLGQHGKEKEQEMSLKITYVPETQPTDAMREKMDKLMEEAFRQRDGGRSASGFSAFVFMSICEREGVPYRLTVYPKGGGYYVEAIDTNSKAARKEQAARKSDG